MFEHVVVTAKWARHLQAEFESSVAAQRYTYPGSSAEFEAALEHADAAILAGNADTRVLNAPNVRWVHVDHAGIDGFAPPELFEDRIVTTSAGRSAPAIADHAVFLMLAVVHDARTIERLRRRRAWQPDRLRRRAATSRRATVIGTGETGRELARRLRAMGMAVNGVRRKSQMPLDDFDDVVSVADRSRFLDVMRRTDVLMLAAGLNDSSHHIVDQRLLDALPEGAIVVNVARGALIDEAALIRALRSGRLAGAGIDVVAHEPLAPWSPLWRIPGVVITPHVSPRLDDRDERSLEIIGDIARDLAEGRRPARALSIDDAYTRGQPVSKTVRRATRIWVKAMRRTDGLTHR